MLEILTRAGCFVAIIILGYFLKKIGFFKESDFTILSRITLRITLPAAIITSFGGKEIDRSLLILVLLAILCGFIYIGIGFFSNLHHSKEKRAFDMLNLPGYNIGTFVIPFAQSFLGPMGVIATSLFDTGNAVICLGGAYSLASMVQDGSGFSPKRLLNSLLHSVPFVCYVIMLMMNLVKIPVLNGTIPHKQEARYSGSLVMIRPAAPGTGVIAGGAMRAVLESVGIRNVLAKSKGSSNPHNLVKATIAALLELRDAYSVAQVRGVSLDTVFNG